MVKVPPAYFGVSMIYMTEPVSESRMVALMVVVLRISSCSFGVKDRFIFRGLLEVRGEWTIGAEGAGVSEANGACIYGPREVCLVKEP